MGSSTEIAATPSQPTEVTATPFSSFDAGSASVDSATFGTTKKSKNKKSRKKTMIIGGALLLVVAVIVVLFLTVFQPTSAVADSILMEGTVSRGNVSSTIEGTGTLSSSSTVNVKIPTGIDIKEVYVKAGDEVTEGQALASVDSLSLNSALYTAKERLDELVDEIDSADTDTAEYYNLLIEQRNTQETYDILSKIAETNTLTASSAGVISAVNVAEDSTTSASSGTGSTDSSGGTSYINYSPQDSISDSLSSSASTLYGNTVTAAYSLTSSSAITTQADEELPVSEPDVEIPTLNLNQANLSPTLGGTALSSFETDTYTATITWSPADKTFKAGVEYSAKITLTPKAGYVFAANPKIMLSGTQEISYLNDNGALTIEAVFSALTDTTQNENPSDNNNNNSGGGTNPYSSGSTSSDAASAYSGSSSSGLTASGSSTTGVSDASSSSTSSNLITAFGISSSDYMTITVSIDEMDILSVSERQSVTIELDALEGETFDGEISRVSKTGTSNGGTTKYSAEVLLEKTDSMLEGMNASVSIIISESADTLMIPSSALQQMGMRTFVYTEKDESTGTLSGEVEVEIGESDGSNVEILSGLSEGDTVYYEVLLSTDANSMSSMFGGGGGMSTTDRLNSGDMPNMDQMPSNSSGSGTVTTPGGGN